MKILGWILVIFGAAALMPLVLLVVGGFVMYELALWSLRVTGLYDSKHRLDWFPL